MALPLMEPLISRKVKLYAFSGIIDGKNHALLSEGGLPLLGYVKGAEVRNLNIWQENGYTVSLITWKGVGHWFINCNDNVTLKSGSSTLKWSFGANITANLSLDVPGLCTAITVRLRRR